MIPRTTRFVAAVLFGALGGCLADGPELSQTVSEVHLADCSEGQIRALAPADATGFLNRAYDWIHRGIPYCQCTSAAVGGYRTDCSGFVSMVWGLPAPGHTTYSFAGGPWDDHVAVRISRDALRTGDALNYPGSVGEHTGHVVLFGGWLNEEHTRFCSLEESHTGTPARVITRSVDPAYLPMRLASRQSCAAHCEGSTLVGGDCGRGDCAAFGSSCVQDGLGARCVFAFCNPTGERDICFGGSHIGHCVNGALTSQGDCGVYGARCVDDALGARCVFGLCPATGESDICVDRNHVSHCSNGSVTPPGDCSNFAAFCSTRAGPAHCVSAFCVESPEDVPVAHDGCWISGGQTLHCSATGAPTVASCPTGQACSMVGGSGHCAPVVCPAAGEAEVCASDRVIGHCFNGSLIRPRDCGAGSYCSTVSGTAPHCVSRRCVRGADEVPSVHSVCVDDTHLATCDATGALDDTRACDGDTRCVSGVGGDRCEPPARDASADATATDATAVGPLRDASATDSGAADVVRGSDDGEEAPGGGTIEGGCSTTPRGARSGWLSLSLLALFVRRRRVFSDRRP